jgi:hypothetical protein
VVTCEVHTTRCRLDALLSVGSGRRPEGFDPRSPEDGSAGAWLAEAARLEGASVPAFRRLARDLARHRAPPRLVRAAWISMHDEVAHARVVGGLARARGGAPGSTRRSRALSERDLARVAIENAVEGCVHETLGAIVATFQGQRAGDPELRAAYARIAVDETRHATLAWDVLRWSLGRLDADARRSVVGALVAAVLRLDARALAARSREPAEALGLPTLPEAARILATARSLLFRELTTRPEAARSSSATSPEARAPARPPRPGAATDRGRARGRARASRSRRPE